MPVRRPKIVSSAGPAFFKKARFALVLGGVLCLPVRSEATVWWVSDEGKSAFKRYTGDHNVDFSELEVGDLNGDGKADIFNATGSVWRVSYGGNTGWKTLISTTVTDVAIGDMNGDGADDVFWQAAKNWYYRPNGTGSVVKLAASKTSVGRIHLGDFDGDGKADVFTVSGSDWLLSSGGSSSWKRINGSDAPFADLRFGDLNGDGATDVFTSTGSGWRVSHSGTSNWVALANSKNSISLLALADVTGDGKDDVVLTGTDHFKVSSAGRGSWKTYAANPGRDTALHLMFADMDGDGKDDIIADSPHPEPCKVAKVPVSSWRGVTGQWDFTCEDWQATVGKDLVSSGIPKRFGTDKTTYVDRNGVSREGAFTYLDLPSALNKSQHLKMYHGAKADHGNKFVDEYTLIMDVWLPNKVSARSFLQTSQSNKNDYDIGLDRYLRVYFPLKSGTRDGMTPVPRGAWKRLAFVIWVKEGDTRMHSYVDGVYQSFAKGTHEDFKKGGRYALYSNYGLLFADESGEAGELRVSSIQFRNYGMTADDVKLLGGAKPNGIPVTAANAKTINQHTGYTTQRPPPPPPSECHRWEDTWKGRIDVKCGCNGFRACNVWEALPSCTSGNYETGGKCKSSTKAPVLATFEGMFQDTAALAEAGFEAVTQNKCETLMGMVPRLSSIPVDPVVVYKTEDELNIEIALDARSLADCSQAFAEGMICALPDIPPRELPPIVKQSDCALVPAGLRSTCDLFVGQASGFGKDIEAVWRLPALLAMASNGGDAVEVDWSRFKSEKACRVLGKEMTKQMVKARIRTLSKQEKYSKASVLKFILLLSKLKFIRSSVGAGAELSDSLAKELSDKLHPTMK